ncbi:MAG: T9SS type A sorting domain-containing protein [Flavobacteriales bacterium]|nr:T9SS type A sorting domain-containing protein [Flavobacteriales bacterium]
MKKLTLFACALMLSQVILANDVRLIVQRVDNHGAVNGSTYRLYAQLATPEQSLHIVYGDQTNPLKIESTAPLFQNQYCGHSAAYVNPATVAVDATAAYDSWITLGYDNSQNNDMWDIGVDFSTFDANGSIYSNNGGWFLIPTDEKCNQNASGLVLLAQFTTTGIVSGQLNLQGWNAPQDAWRANALTFSTAQAMIFGCTDSKASNYSPQAEFNDGSCAYNQGSTQPSNAGPQVTESNWEVFPNPLRDNMLNIQFNGIDIKQTQTRIDIIDMNGKLVGSHSISAGSLIGGNRVVIEQSLAAGTYQAVLVQNGKQEAKTIIVQK